MIVYPGRVTACYNGENSSEKVGEMVLMAINHGGSSRQPWRPVVNNYGDVYSKFSKSRVVGPFPTGLFMACKMGVILTTYKS